MNKACYRLVFNAARGQVMVAPKTRESVRQAVTVREQLQGNPGRHFAPS